jgi:hypothetical protein
MREGSEWCLPWWCLQSDSIATLRVVVSDSQLIIVPSVLAS